MVNPIPSSNYHNCYSLMVKRLLPLMLLPVLVGCHPQIVEQDHVVSADGQHRLTLRYETRDQRAFNFHDLVLQARTATGWETSRVVWKGDATLPPDRRRWIVELHSIDLATQSAIIKIGTESVPDLQGVIHVEYAWVRWDLIKNELLDILQVCDDPFARFTADASN